MVSYTIILSGQEGGVYGGAMLLQTKYASKESLNGEDGIVASLGVAHELSKHTIFLCGELQHVGCDGLEICG